MSQSNSTSTSDSHVKTRILIISDTHNASLYPSTAHEQPFRAPLPDADVLLHCGDLTMIGLLKEYESALSLLESASAPLKLVIAGNHDISLDEQYYARKGQQMQNLKEPDTGIVKAARELWTGERARRAGIVYLEEGSYSFALDNGAKLRVYASPYQPEFYDWAFPYQRHEDRFNPPSHCLPNTESIAQNPIPDFPAIDIVMTHGPPLGFGDEVPRAGNVGCENLLRAVARCRPRLHCFGHIHEGWGAERVRWEVEEEGGAGAKSQAQRLIGMLRSGLKQQEKTPVASSEVVRVDVEKMRQGRAAWVDVSRNGGRELVFGRETLMVNACVMDVGYRPVQGPWLVDLDLERA